MTTRDLNLKYLRRKSRGAKENCWQFVYIGPKSTNPDTPSEQHLIRKSFSDSVYGSPELALKAAEAFRDKYLSAIGVTLTRRKEGTFKHAITNKATEGAPIGLNLITYKSSEVLYYSWHARATEVGQIGKASKSYSIKKYGYKSAYLLARKFRLKYSGKYQAIPEDPTPPTPEIVEWVKTMETLGIAIDISC